MKNPPRTIDDVLARLDEIIAESLAKNDRACLFAYLYRRTTAQIKRAIEDNAFEDNERMERFDVLFASKYIEAYSNYKGNTVCAGSWMVAFDAGNTQLTILQHLLLGMNAHINYDLGISAAEFSGGKPIDELKDDFMKVNQVLKSLTDEFQAKLGRVSRLMFLLDWIGKRNDEVLINFSMVKAREQAWNFALNLSSRDEKGRMAEKEMTDSFISGLGNIIKAPPGKLLSVVLKIISRFEKTDLRLVLSDLAED
jgi:hypothetical protein